MTRRDPAKERAAAERRQAALERDKATIAEVLRGWGHTAEEAEKQSEAVIAKARRGIRR